MATKNIKVGDAITADGGGWAGDGYKVGASARSVTLVDDSDSPYVMGTDESVVLADATSGVITVNLPPAADCAGLVVTVKKVGTGVNAVTVDPDGAELIEGAATYAVLDAANDVASFVCDGTAWFLMSAILA